MIDWLLQGEDEAVCLIDDGIVFSYQDIRQQVTALSENFPGRELALIVADNSLACYCLYLSLAQRGHAIMLLPATIGSASFQGIVSTFRPKYLLLPDKNLDYGNAENLFCLDAYCVVRTHSPSPKLHVDLALLLSTSGSTGEPAFVRLSYDNIRSNAEAICQSLDISSGDRAITTLPMSYTYGLSILHTHWLRGASIIVNRDTIVSAEFWKNITQYSATTFGGVPFTYETLRRLNFEARDLSTLRYLTQAGGKLNTSLVHYFCECSRQKGIDFFVMYGQTEATARMSILPASAIANKGSSIGQAIVGGKFFLCDDKQDLIDQPNTQGELCYRGSNVSLGYARTSLDLGLGDCHQGVLRTGDMAWFDEDGYFYISGRLNRFIKLYGNRINLEHLQSLMAESGYECVCTGNDDQLNMYVIGEFDLRELKKSIKTLLKVNPKAVNIASIDKIPRNSAGKIIYRELPDQMSA